MVSKVETVTGVTRHVLSARERFNFHQYLNLHYVEFGLSDMEFSKKVTEELGIPISSTNVAYARKEFEIPMNAKVRGSEGWQLELIKRIDILEEQVSTLIRERRENGRRA